MLLSKLSERVEYLDDVRMVQLFQNGNFVLDFTDVTATHVLNVVNLDSSLGLSAFIEALPDLAMRRLGNHLSITVKPPKLLVLPLDHLLDLHTHHLGIRRRLALLLQERARFVNIMPTATCTHILLLFFT